MVNYGHFAIIFSGYINVYMKEWGSYNGSISHMRSLYDIPIICISHFVNKEFKFHYQYHVGVFLIRIALIYN